jgi:hypothetical protein
MTDVGRMSVAEPVGKVLADRVGSGHPVALRYRGVSSSIVGQTDDHEACGVRTPTRLGQPGPATPHPRLDHDPGPCSLP